MIPVIHKVDSNGNGKTTQLIGRCFHANGVFVCSDDSRKEFIQKKAVSLNMPLKDIYTINELFYAKEYKKKLYFFEDVHHLIKILFSNVTIGAMSINVKEDDIGDNNE